MKPLLAALLACALASLFHHIHNAQYLVEYPNMPAWLSAPMVYAAWTGATGIGFAGYLALRAGWRKIGPGLLALYGVYGLDALVHYALAPIGAHSVGMNASIWLEAAGAAGLLIVLIWTGGVLAPFPRKGS